MKRYMLFAYDGYYPQGGASDILKCFNDINDAKDLWEKSSFEFGEVVDLTTELVVLTFGY